MSLRHAIKHFITGFCSLMICLLAANAANAAPGVFPFCSWWLETTPTTMNVAYPDTEATYWTTPFIAKPGLQLTIKGQYPQARYFSLTIYDNTFGYFTTTEGVTSGIADFRINPDGGSVNPWQVSGAATGGSFTVTAKQNVTQSMYQNDNTIPLVPSTPVSGTLPSNVGFLILRVYVPAGSNKRVQLPTVIVDDGSNSTALQTCTTPRLSRLSKVSKDVAKVLRVIEKLRNGTTPYAPPCGSNCPPFLQFFLPSSAVTSSVFPNPDNAYITALLQSKKGKVVVVRGLAPTSPAAVGQGVIGDAIGATPVEWTNPAYQVRYWSISNNVYQKPFPVVTLRSGKSVIYGGTADLQTPLDNQGRYTIVISRPADRPANATSAQGVAWLPTQVNKPNVWENLIMRNMLPNADFTNAIQNINPSNYGDPAAAQAVMGAYYPLAASCTRKVFEQGGADACFSAWHAAGH